MYSRPQVGRSGMKWVPAPINNVQRPLPAHDRPERAPQRPGPVPGCPGPVRGEPRCRSERAQPGGPSPGGVAAVRGEAQRAVHVLARGAQAEPPVYLARQGHRARRRGADSPAARHTRAGWTREGGHDSRRRSKDVRGVGSRALRRVRAHAGRRTADAVREALGARSLAGHLPVLVDEVAWLFRPRREGWVIDGTVGMGGHAEAVLETSGENVRLLGVDADPEALGRAAARLARFG